MMDLDGNDLRTDQGQGAELRRDLGQDGFAFRAGPRDWTYVPHPAATEDEERSSLADWLVLGGTVLLGLILSGAFLFALHMGWL